MMTDVSLLLLRWRPKKTLCIGVVALVVVFEVVAVLLPLLK